MSANSYWSKDGKRILTIPNGTKLTPTITAVIEALNANADDADSAYERRRRIVSIHARSEGIAFYTQSEDIG